MSLMESKSNDWDFFFIANSSTNMNHSSLRAWQHEALKNYYQNLAAGVTSLLWEATPGSGKTNAALQVCAHQLETANSQRLIIVVPTVMRSGSLSSDSMPSWM